MQEYNLEKLRGAFKGKKRYEGYTLMQLAADTGCALSTVVRVLDIGRGRPDTMDRVARALGFRSRQDLAIRNGHRHK